MADLLFKCSGCYAPLAVEDDCIGQTIECPECKRKVLVPEAGTAFCCVKCKTGLAAPAEMVGQASDCPNCGIRLTVPKPTGTPLLQNRAQPRPTSASSTPTPASPSKSCPYCSGAIAPAAIVCVHCGINLRTGQKYGTRQAAPPASSDSTAAIVIVTILVILLFGGGVWFWLSNQRSQFEQAEAGRRRQAEEQRIEQARLEQQLEQQRVAQSKKDEQRRNEQAKKSVSPENKSQPQTPELQNPKSTLDTHTVASQVSDQMKAAEQGNSKAQFALAVRLANGVGVGKDLVEASKWLRKAAEQGLVDAQLSLGTMYYQGDGVQADLSEAVKWFRKAADSGSADAALNMGIVFGTGGPGIRQDQEQAAKWFRTAADSGNAQAQRCLSVCFREGRGVSRDPAEAVRWCLKAAQAGDFEAQYNLGIHYQTGLGIAKDPESALKWYCAAAMQGHKGAIQYLQGIGIDQSRCQELAAGTSASATSASGGAKRKDITSKTQANGEEQDPQSKALLEQGLTSQQRGDSVQAAKYFRLAADRGSAWGQNNLGCSYMQGDGVRKDEATGARWIRKAAEQGLKEAQAAMGSCYTAGSGVEKDMAEGARWYRKAAEQGDAPAQHQLVLMYAGGIGVPKSNEEAARWAREAASRGDKEAQGWIAKWDARQGSGTAVAPPSAKVPDGVQDLGHRDPFPGIPQNSKRVVASYETLDAALTAKRGMNNHVLAGPYQAMEESVINAGNAVMTAAPQPKADVEFNRETGKWDLFVVR